MVSLIALGPVSRAVFVRLWPLLCWIDTGPTPDVSPPIPRVMACQ